MSIEHVPLTSVSKFSRVRFLDWKKAKRSALVHDAIVIISPTSRFEADRTKTMAAMKAASRRVLGGFAVDVRKLLAYRAQPEASQSLKSATILLPAMTCRTFLQAAPYSRRNYFAVNGLFDETGDPDAAAHLIIPLGIVTKGACAGSVGDLRPNTYL